MIYEESFLSLGFVNFYMNFLRQVKDQLGGEFGKTPIRTASGFGFSKAVRFDMPVNTFGALSPELFEQARIHFSADSVYMLENTGECNSDFSSAELECLEYVLQEKVNPETSIEPVDDGILITSPMSGYTADGLHDYGLIIKSGDISQDSVTLLCQKDCEESLPFSKNILRVMYQNHVTTNSSLKCVNCESDTMMYLKSDIRYYCSTCETFFIMDDALVESINSDLTDIDVNNLNNYVVDLFRRAGYESVPLKEIGLSIIGTGKNRLIETPECYDRPFAYVAEGSKLPVLFSAEDGPLNENYRGGKSRCVCCRELSNSGFYVHVLIPGESDLKLLQICCMDCADDLQESVFNMLEHDHVSDVVARIL